MDPIQEFKKECEERINSYSSNEKFKKAKDAFMLESTPTKYSYNFTWLGRPIIQYPQDIIAMQEIIWRVKPDLIIETGIAHGGSLIFSASMLELLDRCDTSSSVTKGKTRMVMGIDIDIRKHNRIEIEKHPLSHRIKMMEGSSVDNAMIHVVHKFSSDYTTVMVFLDSNHTHDHVIAELLAYAPLVSVGSYCAVFDTIIEDLPPGTVTDRPWDKGNNPKTAVWEFLKQVKSGTVKDSSGKPVTFEIDEAIHNKLLITVAPDGYLKRIR